MSCGVGRRRGSDPVLLWLWHRPEATAPIRPLPWEPPHAMGAALGKAKRQKKKKKKMMAKCSCGLFRFLVHSHSQSPRWVAYIFFLLKLVTTSF